MESQEHTEGKKEEHPEQCAAQGPSGIVRVLFLLVFFRKMHSRGFRLIMKYLLIGIPLSLDMGSLGIKPVQSVVEAEFPR